MIDLKRCPNNNLDSDKFLEFVEFSPDTLFIMLEIYADESGTHHPKGERPGSEVPVLAGYMGGRGDWRRFCREWRAVLNRYGVQNFHAKDFENRLKQYGLWNENKHEAFKYALAEIAGRNIPIGGAYHVKEHHKQIQNDDTYTYTYIIDQFFNDVTEALTERNLLNEGISIIFDTKTDKKWNAAIAEEIQKRKKQGLRITGYSYCDDEIIIPLQAADMLAHRSRIVHFRKLTKQAEIGTNIYESPSVFDIVLCRNMRPKIGFAWNATDELRKEISVLSKKLSSVRRSLLEIPGNDLGLKNENRKRK